MSDTAKQIKIDDKEYDASLLSEAGHEHLEQLIYTNMMIEDRKMQIILLQRAKNSYIKELKKQILSDKAGFLFEDN